MIIWIVLSLYMYTNQAILRVRLQLTPRFLHKQGNEENGLFEWCHFVRLTADRGESNNVVVVIIVIVRNDVDILKDDSFMHTYQKKQWEENSSERNAVKMNSRYYQGSGWWPWGRNRWEWRWPELRSRTWSLPRRALRSRIGNCGIPRGTWGGAWPILNQEATAMFE